MLMDFTSIFGDYTAIAPMIFLMAAALILPGVHLLGKNRTATWSVALVLEVI